MRMLHKMPLVPFCTRRFLVRPTKPRALPESSLSSSHANIPSTATTRILAVCEDLALDSAFHVSKLRLSGRRVPRLSFKLGIVVANVFERAELKTYKVGGVRQSRTRHLNGRCSRRIKAAFVSLSARAALPVDPRNRPRTAREACDGC